MKIIKSLLFVFVLVVSVGCMRTIRDARNGRTVSESTAISGPGFASLSTNENDQPYDACLARAGSMPNRGLVIKTCMDNAMRVLVREQCPQYYGAYAPGFWRRNPTYLQCLSNVGWMPNGQDEATCLQQVMVQQSTSLCAMLAPPMPFFTTGGPVTSMY